MGALNVKFLIFGLTQHFNIISTNRKVYFNKQHNIQIMLLEMEGGPKCVLCGIALADTKFTVDKISSKALQLQRCINYFFFPLLNKICIILKNVSK